MSGLLSSLSTRAPIPWEDWVETFAHFLHIVSALDSVADFCFPWTLGRSKPFKIPTLKVISTRC
jgi:hypothetical protein